MSWHILFLIAFVASLAVMNLANASESVLILNAENVANELPRHFRQASTPFSHALDNAPSREGLDQLRISGSAQFSQEGLMALYKKLGSPNPFVVVDLRQECHGFVNGNALSWFAPKDWANVGKVLGQIVTEEKDLLAHLKKMDEVTLQKVKEKNSDGSIASSSTIILHPTSVKTEQEIVEGNGWTYLRIPVTDHLPPSKDSLDRFLSFYRQRSGNPWIHFHCAGGDGRTTSFMALVDMLNNADRVSFDAIIERQNLIGGSNLLKDSPSESGWKMNAVEQRIEFLTKFYTSVKSPAPKPLLPTEKP